MSTTRIAELSALIATSTETLNIYFTENDLPTPSLDASALATLPIPDSRADLKSARVAVIEACSELSALLSGPKELLNFKWTAYVSVKIILRFNLDLSFPVGSSTTFSAISEYSGLSVMNVRRVVRHAIYNHCFFEEKQPGIITHSALTATLAKDDKLRNALIVQLDEFWPAGMKVADALEKWPNSEENNQTVCYDSILEHGTLKQTLTNSHLPRRASLWRTTQTRACLRFSLKMRSVQHVSRSSSIDQMSPRTFFSKDTIGRRCKRS
jgi:hypothetical protein